MNALVLELRDALDAGDDHRAAWLLEQLFERADRRRIRLRRRVKGRSDLTSDGPTPEAPGLKARRGSRPGAHRGDR